jgi:hypothetical protein
MSWNYRYYREILVSKVKHWVDWSYLIAYISISNEIMWVSKWEIKVLRMNSDMVKHIFYTKKLIS